MDSQATSERTLPAEEFSTNGSPAARRGTRLPRWAWLVLLVVAAALVAVFVGRLRPVVGIAASGMIEATESDLAPKVQGRLVALRVRDGESVKRGEPLALLERVDPAFSLDAAKANVAAATAQVAVARAAYELQRRTYAAGLTQAQSGVGIADSRLGQAAESLAIERRAAVLAVDQGEAQVSAALAAAGRARLVLQRAIALEATGDVSRQSLDDATAAYAAAASQLQAARDALAVAQANLRNVAVRRLDVTASQQQRRQSMASLDSAQAELRLVEERRAQLAAAEGVLSQARAALGLAQDQLRETVLVAPFDGAVISHNFEAGDLVQPGSAVMTVGDLVHPYLYVYVSESDLPRVKTGRGADVTIDGLPGRTFAGTVTEIATTAEFTPENVQTKEERIEYLVFRVKIQLTDTTGSLKPGLPADAIIHD